MYIISQKTLAPRVSIRATPGQGGKPLFSSRDFSDLQQQQRSLWLTQMILLDYHNKIIEDTIIQRAEQYAAYVSDILVHSHDLNILRSDKEGLPVLEIVAADFDGVVFHISSDNNTKDLVTVSLQWRCAQDLLKNGGSEILKAEYGSLLQATPETGYDVTLVVNVDQPKEKIG
jgi:hypothetical protein